MVANAFSARDLELLTPERFGALERVEQLHYLLRFSLLAPSTHNSVPQAYALDPERSRIELFLDRRWVLVASDPTARQARISVGCALENLVLAAEQYGLASRWTVDASFAEPRSGENARFQRVGSVALCAAGRTPTEAARRSVLRAIAERKVLRAEFDASVAVPEELVSSLRAAVTDFPDLVWAFATTAADRFAWGKLAELALKHELEAPEFRAELGHFVLENDDVVSVRGMRGRELGLDAEGARSLVRELRGELALASEKLGLLSRGERNALSSSSAVCALGAVRDSPLISLETGRAYQRCALAAWRHGFAHAVHAAIVEVPHARAMAGATLLGGRALPLLVFRLGKPRFDSDWRRPPSSRPSLDELLLPTEALGRAEFG